MRLVALVCEGSSLRAVDKGVQFIAVPRGLTDFNPADDHILGFQC